MWVDVGWLLLRGALIIHCSALPLAVAPRLSGTGDVPISGLFVTCGTLDIPQDQEESIIDHPPKFEAPAPALRKITAYSETFLVHFTQSQTAMSTSDTSTSSIMADHALNADTVRLAGLAADLSTTLCSLQEKCGHETTSNDISNIATELALLSQSLWRLHEAMAADSKLYTESFNEDLSEITKELRLIFEEITDCSEELQRADAEDAGSVAWLFKKGRVHKLQKHLEALKTTVVVMRLVLWHGKDYGTHK